jgi:two-component sensor histidine kinase
MSFGRQSDLIKQEGDHRLANLLQLIASGLHRNSRLEGRGYAVADTAISQMTALCNLHRSFIALDEVGQVCATTVVDGVCTTLRQIVVEPAGHNLQLLNTKEFEGKKVSGTYATCLASLVSELIVNAVKHAFSAGQPGTITVEVTPDSTGIRCTVTDDGNGFIVADGRSSHGMRLAFSLAESHGGTCHWESGARGTRVVVALPDHNSSEQAS